jgi:RNA polymerase sigma factor (sigma-70 family)
LATDARLVALVREGNGAAFETIYDRYQGPILSFCRHVLGDPEEAADAVQHTFVAAYNAIVSSEKTILLRAWLFTIARNRCYSVLRARRDQPAAELVEPSTEGLASQVQHREDLRQLLADMRRLPDDQRAAVADSTAPRWSSNAAASPRSCQWSRHWRSRRSSSARLRAPLRPRWRQAACSPQPRSRASRSRVCCAGWSR